MRGWDALWPPNCQLLTALGCPTGVISLIESLLCVIAAKVSWRSIVRSAVCWQRRLLKSTRRFQQLWSRSTLWWSTNISLTPTGQKVNPLENCSSNPACSSLADLILEQVSGDSGGKCGVWVIVVGGDRKPSSQWDPVEHADGWQPAGHVSSRRLDTSCPTFHTHLWIQTANGCDSAFTIECQSSVFFFYIKGCHRQQKSCRWLSRTCRQKRL